MTTHTSKYAGHTPGPMRAMQQPGQIVGVHTYTHCVMYGDDSIADTLTEPDALLFADAPLILAQRDRLAACVRDLIASYALGDDAFAQAVACARTTFADMEQTQ